MYLVSAQTVAGTGMGATSYSTMWSDVAFIMLECSGNNATASLLASPRNPPDAWVKVTSWAMTAGTTSTAQLTTFYPKVMGQVDWVSGGNASVSVFVRYDGRMQGA